MCCGTVFSTARDLPEPNHYSVYNHTLWRLPPGLHIHVDSNAWISWGNELRIDHLSLSIFITLLLHLLPLSLCLSLLGLLCLYYRMPPKQSDRKSENQYENLSSSTENPGGSDSQQNVMFSEHKHG